MGAQRNAPERVQAELDGLAEAVTDLSVSAEGDFNEAVTRVQQAFERLRQTAIDERHERIEEAHSGEAITLSETISLMVRRFRMMASLTQADLAESMSRLGFGWKRITVTEVERPWSSRGSGDAPPRQVSLEELLGLAALFGIPVHRFLLPYAEDESLEDRPLEFAAGRNLSPGTVWGLLFGDQNREHWGGGPDWSPALQVTGATPGDEDWRPARAFWSRYADEQEDEA